MDSTTLLGKLNARLEAIKPPCNMSNETKAIGSKTVKWKAKDLKSLILHYDLLTCTDGLLARPIFLRN